MTPLQNRPRLSTGINLGLSLLLAGTAILFSGCTASMLTNQALAFNKTVHDHRVEQLFLNIVRASLREPMSMTTVSNLSTQNSRSLNIGPYVGNFASGISPRHSAQGAGSVSAGPTMGLTILDNDPDFVKGFMSQVSGETIGYFISQGWDKELLAYLLVEEIEDSEYGDLVNNPKKPNEFKRFQDVVRKNLPFIEIRKGSFTKTDEERITTITEVPGQRKEIVEIFKEAESYRTPGGLMIDRPGTNANLVIRSPEGILYYLGELVRMQEKEGSSRKVPKLIDGDPIFVVKTGANGNASAEGVAILHRGVRYLIPQRNSGRSMQSINFVQQLINLQTKELTPGPSTLRLIP